VYQGVIEIHKVGGSTSKPLEQPSPKSVVFSRRERQVSRLSSSRGTCNYALSTHAQTGYSTRPLLARLGWMAAVACTRSQGVRQRPSGAAGWLTHGFDAMSQQPFP
jgi:hypothetical protein